MVGRRRKIVKYLLGRMTEAERTAFARKYFEDDALFEEVVSTENDLIDRYVRGQLDEAERSALESYLARVPDGKLKVSFARTLMREGESARQGGGEETLLRSRGMRRRPGLLAVGAVCLMLVSMSGLLALFIKQRSDLKRNILQRQEVEARLRGTEQELDSTRDKLRQETLSRESQSPEVIRVPSSAPEIDLRPREARAGVPPLVIIIPNSRVVFRVRLDGEPTDGSYLVWLQTMDGSVVWRSKRLRAMAGAARSVVVSIPVGVLRNDTYKLTLFSSLDQGPREAAEWYFKVRRP